MTEHQGGVETVVLAYTEDEGGTRRLTARKDEAGNLLIEGQDLGPGVRSFFGHSEYEYAYSVAAEDLDRLSDVLGRPGDDPLTILKKDRPGQRAFGLRQLIDDHDLIASAWSRVGD